VHGGLAQGIGQALTEGCRYDESGQLVTGSLADYCHPARRRRADFKIDTRETPCTHNPLGSQRAAAKRARSARPRAVMNAITDALGVKDLAMPATAQTVWRTLQKKAA
jgi:carbon-monoxide dehydrogenase large subunit